MQRTIEYTSEIRHAMEDAQTAHAKLIFLSNSLAAIDSAGEAIDANSVEGLCYLLGDAADAIDALLAALNAARREDMEQGTELGV